MEETDTEALEEWETSVDETCRDDAGIGAGCPTSSSSILESGISEEENRLTYGGPTESIKPFARPSREIESDGEQSCLNQSAKTANSVSTTSQQTLPPQPLGTSVTDTSMLSKKQILAETFKLVRRFYEKTVLKDNGCLGS